MTIINKDKNNSINFDSFFTEMITDNNGTAVIDMNAGLDNLYKYFNENAWSLEQVQLYLVTEFEENYPDLVALHSVLGDQQYWWWILLLNRLEDPLEDIKQNWVYAINSYDQISSLIQGSNNVNSSKSNSRIGTVVELN